MLGNRGSALALAQTRIVLSDLTTEWPDLNITQRTIKQTTNSSDDLLAAVKSGSIQIAVLGVEDLPVVLPEGLVLAAVTKRLEPRSALVAKGTRQLSDLPDNALVGVCSERDAVFVQASHKQLRTVLLSGDFDADLARLAASEIDALIVPSADLIYLDRRQRIDATIDQEELTPAAGQGSLALVVEEHDDMAYELAYTMQHRPSFDRVKAERSFMATLEGKTEFAVGALANVTVDGDLTLFGALAAPEQKIAIQAEISGDASEAEELGKELAGDVLEQVQTLLG